MYHVSGIVVTKIGVALIQLTVYWGKDINSPMKKYFITMPINTKEKCKVLCVREQGGRALPPPGPTMVLI